MNYGASKAALESFSAGLSAEVGRFGIVVTVFVAAHTDTESGRTVVFDGGPSLPVSYTAGRQVRAIDRAPGRYPGSPVYRAWRVGRPGAVGRTGGAGSGTSLKITVEAGGAA